MKLIAEKGRGKHPCEFGLFSPKRSIPEFAYISKMLSFNFTVLAVLYYNSYFGSTLLNQNTENKKFCLVFKSFVYIKVLI